MHFGFNGYMIFGQLIFFLIMIFIFVWLLREKRPSEDNTEILKRRLAKGEITEKEYDRLMKKL